MNLLIVRLSALGDVIQGIPCLVALKESFPDWRISWLVEEPSAAVLVGHPHLHKLFVLTREWRKKKLGVSPGDLSAGFGNLRPTWRALRRERFDAVIDLQGLFKSGLWSFLSGAPRRIGHDRTRELAHWFLNEYVCDRPTFDPSYPLVQRYLDPARYLKADVSKGRYLLPDPSVDTLAAVDALLGPSTSSVATIALCPWSAWPSKNWPLDRWQELATRLAGDFRVLIVGGRAERSLATSLWPSASSSSQILASGILNLVGKTSLPVLAEIFRRCRVVVGPDSGPVHLANATGVPRIVMIFGSTSWRRSGPWGTSHHVVSRDLDCQPCFARHCPLVHFNCLRQLEMPAVLDAVLDLTRTS